MTTTDTSPIPRTLPGDTSGLAAIASFDDTGAIPLIVGISGHRDIPDADAPAIEAQVRAVLSALSQRWNQGMPTGMQARIVVMSPLAEGADQLVARVAIEPQINARLVVPLPMEEDEYAKDFEGNALEAFRNLLKKADRKFVVPLPGECDGGGTDAGQRRRRQYLETGIFVARHCYVLLALWDGLISAKPAGTAQIVHVKLHGCVFHENADFDLLSIPAVGPVYQIVTPRRSHTAPLPDKYELKVRHPDETTEKPPACDLRAEPCNPLTREVVDCLREYNQDVIRLKGPAKPAAPAKEPDLDYLRRQQKLASGLAGHYQGRWESVLRIYLTLFAFAGLVLSMLSFFPLGAAKSSIHPWAPSVRETILITLYLLDVGAIFACWYVVRQRSFHRKYHDYRALSEALRVQFHWRQAAVRDKGRPICAADYYVQYQIGDVHWVRYAMYTMDLPCCPDREPGLRQVRSEWINGQRKYFARKVRQFGGTSRKVRCFGSTFLLVAMFWGVVKVLAKPLDRLVVSASHGDMHLRILVNLMIVFLATTPAFAVGFFAYAHFRGFHETIKRARMMLPLFGRAMRQLQRINKPRNLTEEEQKLPPERQHALAEADSVRRRQAIEDALREVGKQALAENADWLIMHHQRGKLDLPK